MRFRKLRIAFSAVCAILCLLLIVLWVRSYSGLEAYVFRLSQNRRVAVVSEVGEAGIATKIADAKWHVILNALGTRSTYSRLMLPEDRQPLYRRIFLQNQEVYSWKLGVPYWVMVTACVALTIAPWLRWRFSLRTLLIATALVAVVLGLIVWFTP
jgi:hypothetical protein